VITYEILASAAPPSRSDVDDINALASQLAPQAGPLTSPEALIRVAQHGTLLIARDSDTRRDGDGRIVGMECLVPIALPTGSMGRLEDLVVEQEYRSRGIGRGLEERLIDEARAAA
jgi:GNAT superfamily N-acetyltransferase